MGIISALKPEQAHRHSAHRPVFYQGNIMATIRKAASTGSKTTTRKAATTVAKSATKTATSKTTAKTAAPKTTPKAATPKAAAAKAAPTVKKPAAPRTKAAGKKAAAPTAEQRYRMVQDAAYYLAEKNGFKGGAMDYWIAAEAQIAVLLSGK